MDEILPLGKTEQKGCNRGRHF